MDLVKRIRAFFAWQRILNFLKIIFKGVLLIVFDQLKDLAVDVAKTVAEKGLLTDEAKRQEFDRLMREHALNMGIKLKNSVLNLLRENAVAYLKITGKF